MFRSRLAAAAVCVLALLGGCTPAEPVVSPTPVFSSVSGDTNSVPRGQLAEGGMVRLPVTSLPRTWNPWHADAANPDARTALDPTLARWFTYDAAGNVERNPDYLDDVAVTHDGHTVVTLTLNEHVVWGDGRSISLADWTATLRALDGSDRAFKVAAAMSWAGIRSIREGGPRQVVVEFSGIEPDWSRPLALGPARAASVSDAAAFDTGWGTFDPDNAAGPFVVEHTDRLQGVATLTRNPAWWGEQPRLESVVIRAIQPDAVAIAFASNEFDVAPVGLSSQSRRQAGSVPDTAIRRTPGTTGRILRLKADAGLLTELPLRQAVVRALDREALADAALLDIAPDPVAWSNHLLFPIQAGYTNQADATGIRYDAKAANEALTEAGWRLASGRRTKDGRPLSLTLTDPGTDARQRAEAERIVADLDAVGIEVTTVPSGGDLTLESVAGARYPLADLTTRFPSGSSVHDFATKVDTTADTAARADQATQAARLLWQEAVTVPLYEEPDLVAAKSTLANLGAAGFGTADWTAVGWSR